MHPLLCGFLTGLVKYALLKEIFKYTALRFALRNTEEVVCRYDVVIAACLIAVGFTLTEGIITVFFSGANGLIMTLLPYHILFAVMMGFFFSRFLATGSRGDQTLALAVPIILHAFFELSHLALMEAAGGSRIGSMTVEEIMALPYLSLVPVLRTLSTVSYVVFAAMTVIAFVVIGIWKKKDKLCERISRQDHDGTGSRI
ncbi:MAG: PrsW family intramembrane metalloprotease [Clostridia bacterium]|nr:PrsW family intramembrane metalloprotease [Clostridia bacterium]